MAQKAQQNERTEERLRDLCSRAEAAERRTQVVEAKLQAVSDEKLQEKLAVLNAEQRAAEEVRQLKLRPLTPPYTPLHTLAHSCTPSHTHRHTHKHTPHAPLTHPSRTPLAPLTHPSHPSRTPRAPLTRQVLKLSGGRWEAERAQLLQRIAQLEAQVRVCVRVRVSSRRRYVGGLGLGLARGAGTWVC